MARRKAEETRELILAAARNRILAQGPAALRLQDVAADVGITHPGVLHHFGSRNALVDAVVEEGLQLLQHELVTAFENEGEPPEVATILDRVFSVLGQGGHAKMLAWLMMSDPGPFGTEQMLAQIADALHAQHGVERFTRERARFLVLLVALMAFGDGIAGPSLRKSAGLDTPKAEKNFRSYLASIVANQLEHEEASHLGSEPILP